MASVSGVEDQHVCSQDLEDQHVCSLAGPYTHHLSVTLQCETLAREKEIELPGFRNLTGLTVGACGFGCDVPRSHL